MSTVQPKPDLETISHTCKLGTKDPVITLSEDASTMTVYRRRKSLFRHASWDGGKSMPATTFEGSIEKAAIVLQEPRSAQQILAAQRLGRCFREVWVVHPGSKLDADAYDELARNMALHDRISVTTKTRDLESLEVMDVENDRRVYTHRMHGGRWIRFTMPDYGKPQEYIFVHVHIPKNGGTSFHQLMVNNYQNTYLPLYYGIPARRHNYESMARHFIENPQVCATASHSFRDYPHRFGHKIPLYVCFLREPRARALSYFRYAQKDWEILTPEHRKALPENLPEMTASDFFKWRKKQVSGFHPMDAQSNFLGGSPNWKIARRTLERFFFVGITERYDESMRCLKARLNIIGFPMEYESIPCVNTTRDSEKSQTDDCLDQYFSKGNADQQLYQWANTELDRTISELNITS